MPARASNLSLRAQGALHGLVAAGIAIALMVPASLLVQHRLGQASVARYGSTITAQLAALAATPVVTHDRIDLNVITTHLADDAAIVNTAIYTLDDRLISTGGRVPVEATREAQEDTVFTHDISFEAQRVGYVRVVVDPDALAPRGGSLVWFAALLGAVLAAWAGARVGSRFDGELRAITTRLRSAARPSNSARQATATATATAQRQTGAAGAATTASGAALPGAPGQSAATAPEPASALQQLQALAMQLAPDPAPTAPASDRSATDNNAPPYLLVLNLFNQGSLAPTDRDAAYAACIERMQRVLGLYKGRVCRLHGTGLFALLDSIEADDHAFSGICAALLALRVTGQLNDARSALQQKPLGLRGGLTRLANPTISTLDTDLLDELDEALSATVLLSATAKDHALAIERSVFEDLLDNQRVLWTAIRSPIPGTDDAGRFHYQITGLAPSHATLLTSQTERLLADD